MALHKLESNVGGKAGKLRSEKAARRQSTTARRTTRRVTLGVIVGNRGFFPGHLAATGRSEMLEALKAEGIDAVIVNRTATNHGAIESRDEARACADLFRKHRYRIDGGDRDTAQLW